MGGLQKGAPAGGKPDRGLSLSIDRIVRSRISFFGYSKVIICGVKQKSMATIGAILFGKIGALGDSQLTHLHRRQIVLSSVIIENGRSYTFLCINRNYLFLTITKTV